MKRVVEVVEHVSNVPDCAQLNGTLEACPTERKSQMTILIAGIGNIFFGDDAFGVEVVHRLSQRIWPTGVRIVDFGIRGLDLAYTLLEEWDAVILVDAVPRGGVPGALYVLEVEAKTGDEPAQVDPHTMDPGRVLRLAASLGGRLDRLYLVGCEPGTSREDMQMEMSPAVRRAVEEAEPLIRSLVDRL